MVSLNKEIKDFWTDRIPHKGLFKETSFLSSFEFKDYKTQVIFESYEADGDIRIVVRLKLSNPKKDQHVEQELTMGSFKDVDQFFKSSEYLTTLNQRLNGLDEAMNDL